MMLNHIFYRSPNRARRCASAVFVLGTLGLLLTACGGGSATTTTTTTTTGSKTSSGGASFTAFQQCLAKHGVNLPSGAGGGGSPPSGGSFPEGGTPPSGGSVPAGAGGAGFSSNPKFAAAAKACASVEPKGGFGGGADGANSTAFAAYRNCLKLHGVTLPSGTSGSPTSSVDTSSAAYQAAQTACASLRPSAASTPSSTG